MMKLRKCQFESHQVIEGTGCQYICTFNDCKLENRWVCSECLLEQLHHHGRQKQDHIMKQQQFLKYVIGIQEKCKENFQNQSLQDLLKQIEQLIQATVKLKNQILSQIDYYNQQNNDLEDLIIKAKYDFYKLENSQIQQIIYMTFKNYDFKQYNELSREICREANSINENIEKNEQSASLCSLKPYCKNQQQMWQVKQIQQNYIDDYNSDEEHKEFAKGLMKDLNRRVQEMLNAEKHMNNELEKQVKEVVNKKQQQNIKQTKSGKIINQNYIQDTKYEYAEYFKYQETLITKSQISQNGQYLVIGRYDNRLLVFDMKTKIQILEFQPYNNSNVYICKFTLDSKYLVCCDDKGYISQYDVSQNFQLIYANQIHQNWIYDLVFMDNHNIITCSADKSIQITNIKSKQQIRIIENAHDDHIYAIDYNQNNDIIFSSSRDKSIKLFYQSSGKMLFKQAIIHNRDLQQIKLISNNRLISQSHYDLILWDVNYDKKILKNIKILNQFNYNFTSVLDNTNIALICENMIYILDNDLNLITSIKHDVKHLSLYRIVQQNQTNYLLIMGDEHLQILKRV